MYIYIYMFLDRHLARITQHVVYRNALVMRYYQDTIKKITVVHWEWNHSRSS